MERLLLVGWLWMLFMPTAWSQGRYGPGDVVPEPFLKVYGSECFFTVSSIPEQLRARMEGCSFKAMADIGWVDLRYLQVLHRNAEGNAIVGEMVCN